jgi:antitoxin ChpS
MSAVDEKTKEAIILFVNEIKKSYPVVGVVLFGSRARGDFDVDSDADVAVILNVDQKPPLRIGLEMCDVAYDILEQTGVHITPLPVAARHWNNPEEYSIPRC